MKQLKWNITRQAGMGIAYILLIIAFVIMLGALALKFLGGDPAPANTTTKQSQANAATLANQAGALKEIYTLLKTNATKSWNAMNADAATGVIYIGNATAIDAATGWAGLTAGTDYTVYNLPPSPIAGKTWQIATNATAGKYYATIDGVPSADCTQFNGMTALGAVETVAVAYLPATVAALSVTEGSGTFLNLDAYAQGTGCYASSTGSTGRILFQIG